MGRISVPKQEIGPVRGVNADQWTMTEMELAQTQGLRAVGPGLRRNERDRQLVCG